MKLNDNLVHIDIDCNCYEPSDHEIRFLADSLKPPLNDYIDQLIAENYLDSY